MPYLNTLATLKKPLTTPLQNFVWRYASFNATGRTAPANDLFIAAPRRRSDFGNLIQPDNFRDLFGSTTEIAANLVDKNSRDAGTFLQDGLPYTLNVTFQRTSIATASFQFRVLAGGISTSLNHYRITGTVVPNPNGENNVVVSPALSGNTGNDDFFLGADVFLTKAAEGLSPGQEISVYARAESTNENFTIGVDDGDLTVSENAKTRVIVRHDDRFEPGFELTLFGTKYDVVGVSIDSQRKFMTLTIERSQD